MSLKSIRNQTIVTDAEVKALFGAALDRRLEWYETRWRSSADQWERVRNRHHQLLATLKSALTLPMSTDEWKELVQTIVESE